MRTLMKMTKKELKENVTQFLPRLSTTQVLDYRCSEPEVTNSRLQSKIDKLSNQLEVQSAKCRHLESTNQVLSKQVSDLQKDRLVYHEKIEKQYRKELKEKLEEVDTFLKTHHATKETLDNLKTINELEYKNNLEQKIRDLELELNKLRTLQDDTLNQKESAEKEIERYKGLYLTELELRKSIAAELDRSNERLTETNAKLLKERSHTKCLNADSIENKCLTTTCPLNESHLQCVSGVGSSLGISRDCGRKLYPEDEGIDSYILRKRNELRESMTKAIAEVNADFDRACSRLSPPGTATCFLTSTSQVQDPVTTATKEYVDILKKNYMI